MVSELIDKARYRSTREELLGLLRRIYGNIDIITFDGFELPLINPILCLKSRVHNFFAPYKADKLKEAYRIDIALRCAKAYINQMLDDGWNKTVSRMIEEVIDLAKSRAGIDLFVRHKIDVLGAVDVFHPNMNPLFLDERYPRVIRWLEDRRRRRLMHLKAFSGFDPEKNDSISIEKITRQFDLLEADAGQKRIKPRWERGDGSFQP